MKILQHLTFVTLVLLSFAWSKPADDIIAPGLQPQLSLDNNGVVRLVFGRADSIFCATSTDKGTTFTTPAFVGRIAGMHLGMTRGPQLASSTNYSVITAMDKTGNIHYFQLTHATNTWEYKGLVNDVPASAPEGLMSITADASDHFYAVWLDVRHEDKNNICFSALSGKAGTWTKNRLIYISPDAHVCECCKPGIAVNGTKVAVMYRNWLNGSRDLYLLTSADAGKTFGKAAKLGAGSWKLNACPMDGGGLAVDKKGIVHTAWRRKGDVYYCLPNEKEQKLAQGRSCGIAIDAKNDNTGLVTLQQDKTVKLMDVNSKKEVTVGEGAFLKSIVVADKILCAWEQDKQVRFRSVSMP
jgi:hypothetical protein